MDCCAWADSVDSWPDPAFAKRNLDERDPFTPADENGHHLSRSLLEPDVCVRRGSGGPAPRPESNFRKNSPAPNERTIESLPNGDADLKNRSQLVARLPNLTELRDEFIAIGMTRTLMEDP